MSLQHANDLDFTEKVLNSDKPVLVDFWATWCGPCKMLAPVVEEVATDMKEDIHVIKVDVDGSPSIASQFGISSIPTLILFDKGAPVGKMVGFRPADQIKDVIKGALKL